MSIQLDMAYGRSWIRRIGNWSCVFSCEELALIRRISFLDMAYCHQDSLPAAPELPLVSPFLCFDDSKADSESEHAKQIPERHECFAVHDVMVSREAIPFGRPYRTHPNGPCKLLTARKRVGPFPAPILAWRRVSHCLSDRHSSPKFTLNSSSFGSSSGSSLDTSSGLPLDSLSDTTSVHSSGCDASGQIPLGPSTRVASSRFILTEDSREEHMDIGTADVEAVLDLGISDGAHTRDGIGMRVEIATSNIMEDEEEFKSTRGDVLDLEDTLYDTVHYMLKVPLYRITEFETAQRQLEAGQLMASEERAGLIDKIRRLTLKNLKRVAEAFVNYEATRAANALEAKSQIQNGNDGDNRNDGNRNGNHGDRGNNRNGNPNENGRGTGGVVGLTRWFEMMETLFHISNCPEVYQVKYATCTLLDSTLTWWNSHKRIVRVDAAFAMTWRDLMKLMTKVYCPRNEIRKMETELWNLTVKNNDLAA
ncbi:reverse transcriptase domain-containing protein [Tanacetum coccineum]